MNLNRALRAAIGHFGPRVGPDHTWRLTITHDPKDGPYEFALHAVDGKLIDSCIVTRDGRTVAG